MKQVTILALKGSNMGSLDNPRRAFMAVNNYRAKEGLPPLFRVRIAGARKKINSEDGVFTVHADEEVQHITETDLIIIPAFDGEMDFHSDENKLLTSWIIQQYSRGAEIASLCVGAFLLASTGLLNGRSCSTHWRVAEEFIRKFPEVNLVTEKLITDEGGIYTSGGAFSSANLILYLIEKYAGREAAIFCAKNFQVDLDRYSQSPFIIFEGQKGHEEEQVRKAQEFIEKNYQEKITVEQLTSIAALSRRSLERRFKKATSNTVVQYIQRVKIEAAKKHFEASPKNINEVMYEVGYADTKSFRMVFREITGLTPVEYRNKYNKIKAYKNVEMN